MNSLTKRYVISKDASEVIDLLRFLSIVFVVLIHNTPVVPSRISFSSGMGQWFYGLMRHTILDPPIYVFFMISGLLLFRKPFGALENMKKKARTLLVPYVFWNLFWIGMVSVIQRICLDDFGTSDRFPVISKWKLNDWVNAFTGYGNEWRQPFLYPFWFLRDLIILNIVAWPLFWLIRRMPRVCMTVALLVLVLNPPIYIVSANALAMFTIGGVISSIDFKLENIKQIPYCVLLPLWFVAGVFATMFGDVEFICAIEVLIGVVVFIRVAWTIHSHEIWNVSCSSSAFIIYATHEFTLTAMQRLWSRFIPYSALLSLVQWLFLPCIVIPLCVLFGLILRKLLPRGYALVTGGR